MIFIKELVDQGGGHFRCLIWHLDQSSNRRGVVLLHQLSDVSWRNLVQRLYPGIKTILWLPFKNFPQILVVADEPNLLRFLSRLSFLLSKGLDRTEEATSLAAECTLAPRN
jgi:hypothetical protein